jgi:hypothetical protein
MKKLSALLLALAMTLSLASCGQSGSQPATSQPSASQSSASASSSQEETPVDSNAYKDIPETYLTMAAGASGGGWYIMGAAMNDVFEQNMNVHMTLIPGGGSTNPTLVNEGTDVQIGFTYVANAKAAQEGKFDYDGTPHENMTALACLNIQQFLHIVTTGSYNSVEEMVANPKGLKIAVGPRGGGNEILLNRYLEALNTSLDELAAQGADVQYISPTEGLTAIKDGNVNTCNYQAALPLSSLVEALASREMHFVSLDASNAQHAVDTYGYSFSTIPAGTYQYQDSDVDTLCDTVILVINKDVDDDVAFNLAKALTENIDTLVTAHASFAAMDPSVIADCGIDLHPGAAAYYQSAGLL